MPTSQQVRSTTFTVSQDVPSGVSQDGVAYIVAGSSSVTLTDITPGVGQDANGNDQNGWMVNPQSRMVTGLTNQAWDERLTVVGNARYDAGLRQNPPIVLNAGDIVVQFIPKTFNPPLSGNDTRIRKGIFEECNVLFVCDQAPTADQIAPCIWGWAGRPTPDWLTVSPTLDTIVAGIPSYALASLPSSVVPTVQQVLDAADEFNPFYGYSNGTNWKNFGSYESGLLNLESSNYGREMGPQIGALGLMMISDGMTTAQKRSALVRLICYGVQWGHAPIENNIIVGGNGGHHQFHCIPTALALQYTNIGNLPDLANIIPGNTFGQIFRASAANIANGDFQPHDSDAKAVNWRRHVIQSVNGNTITCNAAHPSNVRVEGLVMTRESDGATATVIDGSNQETPFTIDAQPSPPFAVGDVVYWERFPLLAEGDVDWNIQAQNRLDQIQQFNAGKEANYRSLNHNEDTVMVLQAMNVWDQEFDKTKEYVALSRQNNYPTAANEWPMHGDANGGGFAHETDGFSGKFSSEFYNAHNAAIEAAFEGGTPPAPATVSFFPTDGAANVDPGVVLVATFNKTIQFGTGNILLRKGGVTVETFDVGSDVGSGAGQVVIVGNQLFIRPTDDLDNAGAYSVQIAATAIDDTESTPQSYAGIADDTTWNFDTIAAIPQSPPDALLDIVATTAA